MNFLYAKELKEKYQVFGHFYDLTICDATLNCRNILEIRKNETSEEIADVVVIMMNPGSSSPLDKNYQPENYSFDNFLKLKNFTLIPTNPDNAQYQIMRLMELNNWNFVRILNLSDLRNGNSSNFKKEFKKALYVDTSSPHCITHPKRKQELKNALLSKTNKLIAAWGEVKELENSAKEILSLNIEIIGIPRENPIYFQYASPYYKEPKIKWLVEIQKKILYDNRKNY